MSKKSTKKEAKETTEKKVKDINTEIEEKEPVEEESEEKKEKSIYDEMDEDFGALVSQYKENAEIYPETGNITFKPEYTEEITEELLEKCADHVRRTVTAITCATSEIAKEKLKEDKIENSWVGKMELPGFNINATVAPKETYRDPVKKEDCVEYGVTDIIVDIDFKEKHTQFLSKFAEVDKKQFEELFNAME